MSFLPVNKAWDERCNRVSRGVELAVGPFHGLPFEAVWTRVAGQIVWPDSVYLATVITEREIFFIGNKETTHATRQ